MYRKQHRPTVSKKDIAVSKEDLVVTYHGPQIIIEVIRRG